MSLKIRLFLAFIIGLIMQAPISYAGQSCVAKILVKNVQQFKTQSSADRYCEDLEKFWNPTRRDCKVVDLGTHASTRWEVYFNTVFDISSSSRYRVLDYIDTRLENKIFNHTAVSVTINFARRCESTSDGDDPY
jgi:hypothetical protein